MINIEELEKRLNSLKKYNLVFASFFFSLMTLCVKNIDKRIPIYELVLFRSLLSLIITLSIINIKNINPWGKNKPLLILRGVLGTLALVCIFYAIRNMPLSISTVIQYTYPIFISIFAGIFINEKITRNIIFALIIGWIGILVILNPNNLSNINVEIEKKFNSLNKFNLVLASLFFSLMTLCVKNIDKRIPIYELVLFRSLLSLIITLFIIYLKNINPLGNNRPLLILRGVLGTLALVCIFYAIRNMPLSISCLLYTSPSPRDLYRSRMPSSA